jgi:hypothetical protein
VPLIDEDGYVLGSLDVFDNVVRKFTQIAYEVLDSHVRLVRAAAAGGLARWIPRLLAEQGETLEAVAVGLSLESGLRRAGLLGG